MVVKFTILLVFHHTIKGGTAMKQTYSPVISCKAVAEPSNNDLRPEALVETEIKALEKLNTSEANLLIENIKYAYKFNDLRELHDCFKASTKLIG